VHGIHQHQPFFDAAFAQTLLHLRGDVDEVTTAGHVKPQFFSIAFHKGTLPSLSGLFDPDRIPIVISVVADVPLVAAISSVHYPNLTGAALVYSPVDDLGAVGRSTGMLVVVWIISQLPFSQLPTDVLRPYIGVAHAV
jgi:hypothetical protein